MIIQINDGAVHGSGVFAVYMPNVNGDRFEDFSKKFKRVGDDYFGDDEIVINHQVSIKLDEVTFQQDQKTQRKYSPVMQDLINRQKEVVSINYDVYTKEIPILFYLKGELINDKFKN